MERVLSETLVSGGSSVAGTSVSALDCGVLRAMRDCRMMLFSLVWEIEKLGCTCPSIRDELVGSPKGRTRSSGGDVGWRMFDRFGTEIRVEKIDEAVGNVESGSTETLVAAVGDAEPGKSSAGTPSESVSNCSTYFKSGVVVLPPAIKSTKLTRRFRSED